MKIRSLKTLFLSLVAFLVIFVSSCLSNIGMTDQEYVTNIAFMQAHLTVGNTLRKEGSPDEAEAHLGHPMEEQYFLIEKEITNRDDEHFDEKLKRMHSIFIAYPSDPRIEELYTEIINIMDVSVDNLLNKHNYSKELVLAVVSPLLNQASLEYQDSIVKDITESSQQEYKVVELPEYQDSWGFITVAKRLIKKSLDNHDDYLAISAELESLFNILPSPNPLAQLNDPRIFAEKIDTRKIFIEVQS